MKRLAAVLLCGVLSSASHAEQIYDCREVGGVIVGEKLTIDGLIFEPDGPINNNQKEVGIKATALLPTGGKIVVSLTTEKGKTLWFSSTYTKTKDGYIPIRNESHECRRIK